MAVAEQQFKNYVGGEWTNTRRQVRPSSRRCRRPARRSARSRSSAEDVDRAVAAAKAAFEENGGSCPLPSAATSSSASRGCSRSRGRADGADEPRDGQGVAEAGGDVQEAIDMSIYMAGGPPPLRPHDAVRAARQVPDVGADARRRRRRDHALELPDRDPGVEACPGTRGRQHGRAEAGRGRTPLLAERFVELLGRPGLPDGAVGLVHELRRGGGRPARASSRRSDHHFHGLPRDGGCGHEGSGGRAQARPPRARRQERDHRHGRRRPRPRRRGDRLVGLRHLRGSAAPRRAA